jgi:hypothetical protein
MTTTFDYKVRDRTGNLVSGQLAGDSEDLVLKKDLSLFVDGAAKEGTPNAAIAKAFETIAAFSDDDPRQDKAEIYRFIRGGK